MSEISSRHENVSRDFAAVADRVSKWEAPTPVPEWVAGDIVEHLLTWFPGMLKRWAGIELSDVPSRTLAERWRLRTVEVQALLDDRDIATRTIESGGFKGLTLEQAIDQMYVADIFMHTWDLAKSAGIEIHPSVAYATALRERMAGMEEQLRASGQFGPAVESDSGDPVERLMAFVGRDPQWSVPAPAPAPAAS